MHEAVQNTNPQGAFSSILFKSILREETRNFVLRDAGTIFGHRITILVAIDVGFVATGTTFHNKDILCRIIVVLLDQDRVSGINKLTT